MNPPAIPVKDVVDAIIEWEKNPHHQRLGQFLMNKLVPTVTNPSIFYEKDNKKALKLFLDTYQ